jgi:hypothetical protein
MIASAQQRIMDLPWQLFQQLGEEPERVPTECFVLATQLPFLPKGFLYAGPSDTLPETGPFQVRVGFSIHQLHFVVVIPLSGGSWQCGYINQETLMKPALKLFASALTLVALFLMLKLTEPHAFVGFAVSTASM